MVAAILLLVSNLKSTPVLPNKYLLAETLAIYASLNAHDAVPNVDAPPLAIDTATLGRSPLPVTLV